MASDPADVAAAEDAIVCLTNEQRAAASLPGLSENSTLMAVARAHSEDMVSRGFFSHTNPDGLGPADRLTAAGYVFSWYGENIAYRFPAPTPRDFVDAWMNSADHRANILSPQFTEIGVGLANGTPGDGTGATTTQDFGTPV